MDLYADAGGAAVNRRGFKVAAETWLTLPVRLPPPMMRRRREPEMAPLEEMVARLDVAGERRAGEDRAGDGV